jgi:ribosome biogenesis GTPase
MTSAIAPPELGWCKFFEDEFSAIAEPEWRPARVNSSVRDVWRLLHRDGEAQASVSGRLRYGLKKGAMRPVVGDWVAAEVQPDGSAVIHQVLPRHSFLSRRETGTGTSQGDERLKDQVIVANVDVALVVCGLDRDFSLRRIERYITLAHSSGMEPVVVLTKADQCAEVAELKAQALEVAQGIGVGAVDSKGGEGVDWVRAQIHRGKTACLMGSSGAGKSTLINRLLGDERQRTQEVSAVTGKGQHTTTHRELFVLPGGGIVIDNPGVREIVLAENEAGLVDSFSDIEQFSKKCRFRDCRHTGEPGCAAQAAVDSGALPADRLDSYRRLRG